MMQRKSLNDYLLLFGIGLIWGGQFLFNAKAIESFPPITVAAARVLIGALTLSILSLLLPAKKDAAPAHGAAKRSVPLPLLFVLIALFEAVLPLFLIVWGQQYVDSSVTAVLVGSVPILTLILSLFMSRHSSFGLYSGLSVILGFAGILVLVNPSSGAGGGLLVYEMAIFLGCVSFAISLNLLEHIPHGNPIVSVQKILWISAVPLVVAALAMERPWQLAWNGQGVLALVLLGTIGSGLAYVMYAKLTQRRGSVFTSLSNFIVPLVGVILGVAIRNEQFGARQVTALLLIIGALAANELKSLLPALGKAQAK